MHSWSSLRLAPMALALALVLVHGLAAGPVAVAQAPVADRAAPAPQPAPQPAPRTLREKRADGVTVSIPHDLARGAPGGAAMGYTDSTQGATGQGGGWVEPAAMALGYVSPGAGSRGYMPGPNATVGPNAGTGAINPLPFQAFSRSAPDAAVNSAPTPAEVGRSDQYLPRPVNCSYRRFGC
jgi:hypothetical protein